MNELIKYLFDKLILDFQGDIPLETILGFLREDNGREARTLLAKLINEKDAGSMLITLADCLRDQLRTGIDENTFREQLNTFAES